MMPVGCVRGDLSEVMWLLGLPLAHWGLVIVISTCVPLGEHLNDRWSPSIAARACVRVCCLEIGAIIYEHTTICQTERDNGIISYWRPRTRAFYTASGEHSSCLNTTHKGYTTYARVCVVRLLVVRSVGQSAKTSAKRIGTRKSVYIYCDVVRVLVHEANDTDIKWIYVLSRM